MKRSFVKGVRTWIAMVGALGALGVVARAEAQCLQPPSWVSGPSGDITEVQPTLSWAAVPGATGYTLYVRDAITQEWFLRKTGITTTSYRPGSAFPINMATNWKVKGTTPTCEGLYANGPNFTIHHPAMCPPDIAPWPYPLQGEINTASPTFRWTAVPGATEYVIDLLWAPDGGYVFGHADSTDETFINLGPLPVGPGLRWKIKPECNEHYGPFSFIQLFNIVL